MIRTIFSYLPHLLSANAPSKIQPAFLASLLMKANQSRAEALNFIEELRRQRRRDQTVLKIEDFGAGYGGKASPFISKTVSEVVKSSARRPGQGKFLCGLVAALRPKLGLELGTNLGFSTLYQVMGMEAGSRFVTLEGAQALAGEAEKHFSQFSLPVQPEIRVGEFSETLSELCREQNFAPEYVLLDGNHRKEPVLEYVKTLIPLMPENAILIVDDIRWSAGMLEAWREIEGMKGLQATVDAFSMGICLIGTKESPQNWKFRPVF